MPVKVVCPNMMTNSGIAILDQMDQAILPGFAGGGLLLSGSPFAPQPCGGGETSGASGLGILVGSLRIFSILFILTRAACGRTLRGREEEEEEEGVW